jgi:hypothetical protein
MNLRYVERTRLIKEHIIIEIADGDNDDDASKEAEKSSDNLWTVDQETVGDMLVSTIDG